LKYTIWQPWSFEVFSPMILTPERKKPVDPLFFAESRFSGVRLEKTGPPDCNLHRKDRRQRKRFTPPEQPGSSALMAAVNRATRSPSYDRELQRRRCKIFTTPACNLACFENKIIFFYSEKRSSLLQCLRCKFGSRRIGSRSPSYDRELQRQRVI
jgi:hypothetical protein